MLTVESHPHLDLGAFVTRFAEPLGTLPVPSWVGALLTPGATAPLASDDTVRAAVRDVLRAFGYKPTGRGKPASEHLIRAVAESALAPRARSPGIASSSNAPVPAPKTRSTASFAHRARAQPSFTPSSHAALASALASSRLPS